MFYRLNIKLDSKTYVLICSFLQVLSCTFFLKIQGFQEINSLLFFVTGLLISFSILKLPLFVFSRKNFFNYNSIRSLFIAIPFLTASFYFAEKIMLSTSIQIEYADMLPIMHVMVDRFLHGDFSAVYKPISEIWNGIQPIYLPAMWLPFVFSSILNVDMRWIPLICIWASVLVCLYRLPYLGNWKCIIFLLGIISLMVWFHFEKTNNVIRLTEEGIVYFYYVLATLALIRKRPILLGISCALCMMSRYSMIGWIPFSIAYLIYSKNYQFLWRYLISFLSVLFLLLIPFGFKPLLLHLTQHRLYIQQAERVWQESPQYFTKSLGMAKFFGIRGVRLNHAILTIGTFVLPGIFFLYIKNKQIPFNLVLLSCFVLSITFFYNFIDVSYLYLFYIPVFINLAIVGWLCMKY